MADSYEREIERMNEERVEENFKDIAGTIAKVIGLVLLLVMLPAIIVAFITFSLLRNFRQKPSVIGVVALILSLSSVIYAVSSDALGKFTGAIQQVVSAPKSIAEHYVDLLPLYLSVAVVLGSLVGFVIASWQVRQMKKNPHRTQLSGSWMYRFEFRMAPWEIFKRKSIIKGLKDGKFSNDPNKTPLGLEEDTADDIVYRYGSEAEKSFLISGASGSGKTITMLSMIRNDIRNQVPVVVIDFKRSPEFASKLASWSDEFGGEFYHFVNGKESEYNVNGSPGQATYDPMVNGSKLERAEMMLNLREYDTASSVYKANMRQVLQVLFGMLDEADRHKTKRGVNDSGKEIDWNNGGIYQLGTTLNGNIDFLTGAVEGKPIEDAAIDLLDNYKDRRNNQIKNALEELRGQMRTIIASAYGPWLKTSSSERQIDLFKLTNKPGSVILFSLNADSEKEFSQYMGSMIFSDLNILSAKRRNHGTESRVSIYVDEFQAVPPTAVTSLLEKARESKMGMTLSSQSFDQVISATQSGNGEAYLAGILDTVSNFVIHSGATQDSAIRLSKLLGEHSVTKYSSSNKNENSLFSLNRDNRRNQTIRTEEINEWVFSPSEFMTLSAPSSSNGFKSTAVVINKAVDDPKVRKRQDGAVARTVWMIPESEVVGKYYTPKMGSSEEGQNDENVSFSDHDNEPSIRLGNRHIDSDEEYGVFVHPDEEEDDHYDDNDSSYEGFDGGFSYELVEDEEGDQNLPLDDVDEVFPVKTEPRQSYSHFQGKTSPFGVSKPQEGKTRSAPTRKAPSSVNKFNSAHAPLPDLTDDVTKKSPKDKVSREKAMDDELSLPDIDDL